MIRSITTREFSISPNRLEPNYGFVGKYCQYNDFDPYKQGHLYTYEESLLANSKVLKLFKALKDKFGSEVKIEKPFDENYKFELLSKLCGVNSENRFETLNVVIRAKTFEVLDIPYEKWGEVNDVLYVQYDYFYSQRYSSFTEIRIEDANNLEIYSIGEYDDWDQTNSGDSYFVEQFGSIDLIEQMFETLSGIE